MLGEELTAFFIIISDTDSTFNFLVAIMYSQLFNLLCDKAAMVYNGELPIHVRFILDEFANIGEIPQFYKIMNVIRSRNISASIILQSKAQIKAVYKERATEIEDDCNSFLFLGTNKPVKIKNGLLFLAQQLKLPIIPVCVDTGLYWPKHGRIKSGTAHVCFGKELPSSATKEQIQAAINEPCC